jgi:hypothetical protein
MLHGGMIILKCRLVEEDVRQKVCMVMRCKWVYILTYVMGLYFDNMITTKEDGNLCVDVKHFGYLLYLS